MEGGIVQPNERQVRCRGVGFAVISCTPSRHIIVHALDKRDGRQVYQGESGRSCGQAEEQSDRKQAARYSSKARVRSRGNLCGAR